MFERTPQYLALSFIALAALAACAEDAPDEAVTGTSGPLTESLTAARDTSGMPGIGVVVVGRDGVLDIGVAGVRRSDRPAPLQNDDPFHIGSVTKPITATVIGQLVEEGRIAWDTPVADVLPDVMSTAQDAFAGLTLSHLLAHEAGLMPMEEEEELASVPTLHGDIRQQRRQFSRWVFRQDPAVEPAAEYRYSNAHFVVAAAMAEEVTGATWESLVQSRVFDPLGMSTAGFGWPARAGEAGPWGHRIHDDGFAPVDPNGGYALPQYFAPAGDIHASLGDMASFLGAYLAAWDGEASLLNGDSVRRMYTRRLRGGLGWGSTSAFGYEPVAMFSGSADTFLMLVVVVPDAGIGVAVAANAFSEKTEAAVVDVLRQTVARYVNPP